MRDSEGDTNGADTGLHGQKPALQVICLGSGGGPSEDNVTSFLVRSTGSEWAKNSLLAVDAGSHLGPITKILEREFPSVNEGKPASVNGKNDAATSALRRSLSRTSISPDPSADETEAPELPEPTLLNSGPFAGLTLPNESARANALHLLRTYISTYLITHPHLDHISGFAINTAAFHATSRPKTLAALPSTVNALKDHIFNDSIWPNLTDEDGGVGFVTFQRLKEGGDPMIGEGEGRGYIDVCDGLGVRAFKVSHGVCTKSPPSHHHRGSIGGLADAGQPPYNGSIQGSSQPQQPVDPASAVMQRSFSIPHTHSGTGTPGSTTGGRHANHHHNHQHMAPNPDTGAHSCVVDSTAFFVRDEHTHREVLIFGDVEPDSISLSPRNHVVWQEAARKIAHGLLGGVLIESSYDDSQADEFLFGHLNPRHLVAELQTLAAMVGEAKVARAAEERERERSGGVGKKRKRSAANALPNGWESSGVGLRRGASSPEGERKRSRSLAINQNAVAGERRRSSGVDYPSNQDDQQQQNHHHHQHGRGRGHGPSHSHSRSTSQQHVTIADDATMDDGWTSPRSTTFPVTTSPHHHQQHHAGGDGDPGFDTLPLQGIKIVIIHIKDTFKDGPHISQNILAQLQEHEARLREEGEGLGCEFVVSESGQSYWF